MKRYIYLFLIFQLSVFAVFSQSAGKHYMIPDIGVSGYATYVEIIARYDSIALTYDSLTAFQFNSGGDGFFLNNAGNAIRVVCMNSGDYEKVSIGPVVVENHGSLISTHIFVHSNVFSNSMYWYDLNPEFKIPIGVMVSSSTIFIDTFYIIKPFTALTLASPEFMIGSNNPYVPTGIRSPRGAMIFEDFNISGSSQPYNIYTGDCDPYHEGNQGYLPVTIISLHNITIASGTTLSVNATLKDAGPGGGGGGCGSVGSPYPISSGSGFSAGGFSCTPSAGQNGYNSSGESTGKIIYQPQSLTTGFVGSYSLNGVRGGKGRCDQGGGGGTGFPFGYSGAFGNAYTTGNNNYWAYPGQYGSGSAGGEIQDSVGRPFGGGGGANGTKGIRGEGNYNDNGGNLTGNKYIIPLHGGSGGGAGNVWSAQQGGNGGGGGGGIKLYSLKNASISSVTANGGDGTDGNIVNSYYIGNRGASGGGGGAGGCIIIGSKANINISDTIKVDYGKPGKGDQHDTTISYKGGRGGYGRIRIDGSYNTNFNLSDSASFSIGPTTDTSYSVSTSFVLSGTGDGNTISIYLKSKPLSILDNSIWMNVANVVAADYVGNTWHKTITLDNIHTMFFLVARQEVTNPVNGYFADEPKYVLSQAAANVLIINKPPIANNDTAFALPNVSNSINVTYNDYDPNNDPLSISIFVPPANGTAVVSGGNVIYTPNPGFNGCDVIQVIICDNGNPSLCDTSIILISVNLLAQPYNLNISEDGNGTVVIPGTSIDLSIATMPQHGTATLISNTIFFNPFDNYSGTDIIVYQICDSINCFGENMYACDVDTIYISISEINDAPVIVNNLNDLNPVDTLTFNTLINNTDTICIPVYDVENSVINVSSISFYPNLSSANGTIYYISNSSCFYYTPDLDFQGIDSMIAIICDDGIPSLCDTVFIIEYVSSNYPPEAPNDTVFHVTEDVPLSICFGNIQDPNGDQIFLSDIASLPNHGTLVLSTINDTCLTYSPTDNFNGNDEAVINVCDNGFPNLCVSMTIHFIVDPVDDPPQIINEFTNIEINEDDSIELCLETFDYEHDILYITQSSLAYYGTIETSLSSDTCFLYYPEPNYYGNDTITIYVCEFENSTLCAETTFPIEILSVNDSPSTSDAYVTTQRNASFDVDLSTHVTDIDDNTFNYYVIRQPSNGSITNSGSIFYYDPKKDYTGKDTIKVEICDLGGLCDTSTVFISVDYNELVFPNGFSPNNDNINDYYFIEGLSSYALYTKYFSVFNRWGNLVYENTNYNNEWNGTSNISVSTKSKGETLPEGTYFYYFEVVELDLKMSGYVVIKY